MPTYITPDGHRALTEEYNRLLKVERPKTTREVAYAASLGDRSENAEYIYGKKRLREIDSRLHYLQRRLEDVEIVDPTSIRSDRIRFGATVEVEDDEGEVKIYKIVGIDEVDIKAGRISYKSPMGKAMLGKAEGEDALVQAPSGNRTLTIVSITYV